MPSSVGSNAPWRWLIISWLDHTGPLDHLLAGFLASRLSSLPSVLQATADTPPKMLLSPLVPTASTTFPPPPSFPSSSNPTQSVLQDTEKSSLWAASSNWYHSQNSCSIYTIHINHPTCLLIISYYLLLSNAASTELVLSWSNSLREVLFYSFLQ